MTLTKDDLGLGTAVDEAVGRVKLTIETEHDHLLAGDLTLILGELERLKEETDYFAVSQAEKILAQHDALQAQLSAATERATLLQAAVHERVAEREALKAEVARLREGLEMPPTVPAVSVEVQSCLTPGCKYYTRITSYDFKRSATLKVEVDLPGPLHLPEVEDRAGGKDKLRKYFKLVENVLHRHIEAAVAEIGQQDIRYGGTLAKNWPVPPVTNMDAWEVGHEIGYRKGKIARARALLTPKPAGAQETAADRLVREASERRVTEAVGYIHQTLDPPNSPALAEVLEALRPYVYPDAHPECECAQCAVNRRAAQVYAKYAEGE